MMNLAAISLSFCVSPDVDPDPKKRYKSTLLLSILYFLMAILGGSIVVFFNALPTELVLSLAGIALFGTMVENVSIAWQESYIREASLITLLTTASGIQLLGLGSAVWGLVFGMLVYIISKKIHQQKKN